MATRLVAEREEEIRAFVPEEYWTLEVTLDRIAPNQGSFKTQFYGREKKLELKSREQVEEVLAAIQDAPFRSAGSSGRTKPLPGAPLHHQHPPAGGLPEAEHEPRRTMSIAQQLYEGVDIEGRDGGSHHLHENRLPAPVRRGGGRRPVFAGARYGQDYLPAAPRQFKAKAGAQDAHEAIRPSNVELTPESIKKDLTSEQFRLYKLIWSRFLASQMAAAVYDSVGIEVTSAGYVFKASRSEVKFPGFLAVYEEGRDEDGESSRPACPTSRRGSP